VDVLRTYDKLQGVQTEAREWHDGNAAWQIIFEAQQSVQAAW
jgi:hypothetical protein